MNIYSKLLRNKFLFLAILSFVFIHFAVLKPAARFLIVNDTAKPSDAVVVLGSGLCVNRVVYAIELYENGIARRIIFTGQEMSFHDQKIRYKGIRLTEPLFSAMLAKLYGIPEDAIFLEERSHNTYEDAKYVKEDLINMGMHSAIIVSEPYHMRRVSIIFKKVFKNSPISLTFSPMNESNLRQIDLWSVSGIKYIISEYTKILYYLIWC